MQAMGKLNEDVTDALKLLDLFWRAEHRIEEDLKELIGDEANDIEVYDVLSRVCADWSSDLHGDRSYVDSAVREMLDRFEPLGHEHE